MAAAAAVGVGFGSSVLATSPFASSTQTLGAGSGLLSKVSAIKYIAARIATKIPKRVSKDIFFIEWTEGIRA